MRTDTRQTYHERMLTVLVHIRHHLDEELALDDLARVAAFSPYHFHRLFKGMMGEGVKEYVRRLRLERAAHRLKFSSQQIIDLAFDARYESHEAFTRAFHAMFGESPTQFRAHHQAIPFKPVPSGAHYVADGTLNDFMPIQRGALTMEVRMETIDPMRVVFVRHVGPYEKVSEAWRRLMMWAGMRGLLRGKPMMIGIVHDDPEVTPAGKIRYDACLPVNDRFQPKGDVGVQEDGEPGRVIL